MHLVATVDVGRLVHTLIVDNVRISVHVSLCQMRSKTKSNISKEMAFVFLVANSSIVYSHAVDNIGRTAETFTPKTLIFQPQPQLPRLRKKASSKQFHTPKMVQ